MYIDPTRIREAFPLETPREGQLEAVEFAVEAINNGKKVIVLECPTGGGKSAIAMTLAELVRTSYYLTSTKQLQDQLVRDYDGEIVELKGRGSYPCTFYNRNGHRFVRDKIWTSTQLDQFLDDKRSCNNGYCKSNHNKNHNQSVNRCPQCFLKNNTLSKMPGTLDVLPPGIEYSTCPYFEQVYKAINNRKVVMNFSSFLYQTQNTKRFNSRDLLIIDEGHNTEPQLLDYISLTITDQHLEGSGIFLPEFEEASDYATWFKDMNIDNILSELLAQAEAKDETKKVEDLKQMLFRYVAFRKSTTDANDPTEWVCEYNEVTDTKKRYTYRSVTLKPVYVHHFVSPLLFKYGNAVVLLSATFLDVNVLCRSLGIDKEHVAARRMKNRFPAKNRPIYLKTVAKMVGGKANMHNWAPAMTKAVNEISLKYPDKKGIIHTQNFAILDHLLEHCDKRVSRRFLTQRQYPNKQELMKMHVECDNTIIVAPAMHEGVDLHGDLSRFQIICKVPYPDRFSNKQLDRRADIDPKYYNWLTALRLVQSAGRSIRSETDYADTYIIDEAIYRFLDMAGNILPDWFKEAIIK